jgi:hypothetical protein
MLTPCIPMPHSQAYMDKQRAAEAEHRNYWSQIVGALKNPICLTASFWNCERTPAAALVVGFAS